MDRRTPVWQHPEDRHGQRALPVPHAARRLERRGHRPATRGHQEPERAPRRDERRRADSAQGRHHPDRRAHEEAGRRSAKAGRRYEEASGLGEEARFHGGEGNRSVVDNELAALEGTGEHAASELLEVERLTTALTAEWLEQHAVLPLRLSNGVVVVGTWSDAVEALALDDLRLTFGVPVKLERFGEHDMRGTIRRVYAPDAVTAEGLLAGLSGGEGNGQNADEIPLDDLLHLANEAPVVRLVNLLIIEALDARAAGGARTGGDKAELP